MTTMIWIYLILVVVVMFYLIRRVTRKPKHIQQRDEVTLHVRLGADERKSNNDNNP
jgi:uncharacterized membrane protein